MAERAIARHVVFCALALLPLALLSSSELQAQTALTTAPLSTWRCVSSTQVAHHTAPSMSGPRPRYMLRGMRALLHVGDVRHTLSGLRLSTTSQELLNETDVLLVVERVASSEAGLEVLISGRSFDMIALVPEARHATLIYLAVEGAYARDVRAPAGGSLFDALRELSQTEFEDDDALLEGLCAITPRAHRWEALGLKQSEEEGSAWWFELRDGDGKRRATLRARFAPQHEASAQRERALKIGVTLTLLLVAIVLLWRRRAQRITQTTLPWRERSEEEDGEHCALCGSVVRSKELGCGRCATDPPGLDAKLERALRLGVVLRARLVALLDELVEPEGGALKQRFSAMIDPRRRDELERAQRVTMRLEAIEVELGEWRELLPESLREAPYIRELWRPLRNRVELKREILPAWRQRVITLYEVLDVALLELQLRVYTGDLGDSLRNEPH